MTDQEGASSGAPKLDLKGNRKIIIPVVVAAGAFVGWRYWVARQAGTGDASAADGTSDFELGGEEPTVIGAVPSDNSFGDGSAPDAPSVDDFGFHGTTNDAWSQYALSNLSQSDTWSYTDIATALGNYLGGKPLSDAQQNIVRAAIAIAGYPPVGTHSIVPGGNTKITVAPSGLHVGAITGTTIEVSFSAVPGASGYRGYRGAGVNTASTNSSPIKFAGLTPNTSYTLTVAAMDGSGAIGPKSSPVTAKTKPVTLKAPTKPHVSAVQRSSAHLSTAKVAGATGYNWYLNNVPHGHSDAPSYTMTALHPKTTYHVSVAADTATQGPGPKSGTTSFKTKS